MSERVPSTENERIQTVNRRRFLRASGVVAAAGSAAYVASPSELRGATFAKETVANAFAEIQKHENDHVAFLVNALGSNARPKPTFQNLDKRSSYTAFLQLSNTFENVGSGAYTGAAPHLQSHDFLASAATIAMVEGHHAGFLQTLLGKPLTENNESFQTALTPDQVDADVAPFIADLNGGPPVTYSQTDLSLANDVMILNFALALEYLEREFYNINVPAFFPNGEHLGHHHHDD